MTHNVIYRPLSQTCVRRGGGHKAHPLVGLVVLLQLLSLYYIYMLYNDIIAYNW